MDKNIRQFCFGQLLVEYSDTLNARELNISFLV